jgi:hypothetical protein
MLGATKSASRRSHDGPLGITALVPSERIDRDEPRRKSCLGYGHFRTRMTAYPEAGCSISRVLCEKGDVSHATASSLPITYPYSNSPLE